MRGRRRKITREKGIKRKRRNIFWKTRVRRIRRE